jgi:hypothetical protein
MQELALPQRTRRCDFNATSAAFVRAMPTTRLLQRLPFGGAATIKPVQTASSSKVRVCLQVRVYLEVAVDGVEIRANCTHGTQIFVVKTKPMPGAFASRAANVNPLLIIPGPKAPKSMDVYWYIILKEFFMRYGPGTEGVRVQLPQCAEHV